MQPAIATDDPTDKPTDNKPTAVDSSASAQVFDPSPSRTYTISVPHPDYDKGKTCTVRFPTDEEWCRRARQQVSVSRSIGRDKIAHESKGDVDANLALLNSIRVDDGLPEFDEYEAGNVLDRIGRCQITSVLREGNQYRITMDVPGAEVTHVLKIPTQRQIFEFGRSAVKSLTTRQGQETRVLLEPSGELWGKLNPDVAGYPAMREVGNGNACDLSAVPITHKDTALTELLAQVRAETSDSIDPKP